MTEVIVPLTQVVVRPEDVDDLGWQDRALCAQTDPEAFFPEKGGSTREAKRVCRSCEVRAECLEYALENDERFGIWGGLSERERRRIKRERPGRSRGSVHGTSDRNPAAVGRACSCTCPTLAFPCAGRAEPGHRGALTGRSRLAGRP